MMKRNVFLKVNLEVHTPYKTVRYEAGERALPRDLAALVIRNGWALPVKTAPIPKEAKH